MSDHIRMIRAGAATATIINIGDVHEDLNPWFAPAEPERTTYAALFAQPARLPIQCIHLAHAGSSILVDAGVYDYPPDSPQLIPGYTPPPDLLTSLAEAGIDTKTITAVIITHAHGDHFNALTAPEGVRPMPVFPNARHYLGRGDWEKMQPALADPNSLESRTFGVLHERGQLALVENETTVASGVTIIPAPGESPGHQIVRVQSDEQVLYCIGDLYHVPVEVEQPTWAAPWNHAPTTYRSRMMLNERAIREDALLIATHIAGVGKVQKTANGYSWTNEEVAFSNATGAA
jgi:glyoxylase-like metal-dependent hydrolase (beta-lactamase superfamily II)